MGLNQAASLAFEPIAYERVSVQEASRSLEDKRPVYAKDWKLMRQPAPIEPLLDTTRAWLAALPVQIQTWALAQRFPRIANRLASLWRTPVQCENYLTELLLVRRRDCVRQGFPPQVARELAALSVHHAAIQPSASDVLEWGLK
jgi:hypothetical protein